MPPDARRPAELLIADVARLRRLVDDLMEISRLDASGETVQPRARRPGGARRGDRPRSRGWDERPHRGDGRGVARDRPAAARADRRRTSSATRVEHGGGDGAVRSAPTGRPRRGLRRRARASRPSTSRTSSTASTRPTRPEARRGQRARPRDRARERTAARRRRSRSASEEGRGTRFTLRLPVTEPLHDR